MYFFKAHMTREYIFRLTDAILFPLYRTTTTAALLILRFALISKRNILSQNEEE